ncbi:MAG: asparagine--tRNA ligase [Candidatus Lernaella stagnicola]|nr:asparagine--tRNA ligase [Candidatus Lernaella stagnicola]
MSQFVLISDAAKHIGETVIFRGWLYNRRSSGKLHFLQVRDGTQIIQCVMFKGDFDEDTFKTADTLPYESSIELTGEIKEDKRSPLGVEMSVKEFKVVAETTDEYPITLKEHGTDFLMNHRHLWLRSPRQHAILRVRHTIVKAIRDFLDDRDFVLIDAPIFTPNASEGTSTLFATDYFGDTAYLSQSGQLYMEPACQAFNKVYCFGPTFRAEKSKTRRHLTEFWMVEPEVAFMDLAGDMDLMEEFVEYIVQEVLKRRRPELELLERDIGKLEKIVRPFPRLQYDEAVEMLAKLGHPFEWGNDFGGEDETVLSQQFEKPLMVHRYPAAVKAFYMKKDPDRPELSLSVDMLGPEGYGEIIGAGEREDNIENLIAEIERHNLPMEHFQWYLDVRRFGSVPHAGFGLGLERTVAWICGLKHIRETIPFPRLMGRLNP